MTTLNQRLALAARATLILPFLLAALLGLGLSLHTSAASHAASISASASYHQVVADADAYPPGD